MPANSSQDVGRAIDKLKMLRGGELAVLDVIACGKPAIPALRALLLEPEPSGLFEVRCRAVEALAALGAFDVLIEFLSANRVAADPIERLGDDAVLNAAALALVKSGDPRAFKLLLDVAKRACLIGAVGALGRFRRIEAIPFLVAALEDDGSRSTAEAALRRLGASCRAALLDTARSYLPSLERESESSVRRRRSALKLLAEIGIPQKTWPALRHLMRDHDATISVLACKACLAFAPPSERHSAIHRLIELLADTEWMLRGEIADCLVVHFSAAREIIASHIQRSVLIVGDISVTSQTECVLRQIQGRVRRQSWHEV